MLKLIALLAVAGLIGFVMYWLFIRQPPRLQELEPVVPDSGAEAGLPTAGLGTDGATGTRPSEGPGRLEPSPVAQGGETVVVVLTTSAVTSPTLTASGDVAYYDPNDGRFYTITSSGKVELLSNAQFPKASSVVFAPEAQSAVIEFPDGSNVVYSFDSGSQYTLPAHWEGFAYSDDGSDIGSKSVGVDPSNRTLVVTSADGTNTKVIAALGENDDAVTVNWSPSGQVVGFSATGGGGNAFGQNQIFLIGEDGEDAGFLLVNGSNFQGLWSPDGSNILYSVADAGDSYRASLWYADSKGDGQNGLRIRLGFKTTVDKCTFASSSLAYCAVPTEMPIGGGLGSEALTSPDNLYTVSLPSGKTELLAIPAIDSQMHDLHLSTDGSLLYYTDNRGRLSYIRLR